MTRTQQNHPIEKLPQGGANEQRPAKIPEGSGPLKMVPIGQVRASAQIRKHFDEAALENLTLSVREVGILQPLGVRPLGDDRYLVIMGERRLIAAKRVGLTEVPIREIPASDNELRKLQVIENLQRDNLNPIERTEALLTQFCQAFEMEADEAVRQLRALRKTKADNPLFEERVDRFFRAYNTNWESFIAVDIRNLSIPDDLKSACRNQGLEISKAREIAKLNDPVLRGSITARAVTEKWTLATTRIEVAQHSNSKRSRPQSRLTLDTALEAEIMALPEARQKQITRLLRQVSELLNKPTVKRRQAVQTPGPLASIGIQHSSSAGSTTAPENIPTHSGKTQMPGSTTTAINLNT